jgi:hypothetical protein
MQAEIDCTLQFNSRAADEVRTHHFSLINEKGNVVHE